MSSSTSSLGSSSAPIYFNGMSNFAASLNNQISQEVEIASLPIALLDNDVTTLTNQVNELQTLQGEFSGVQNAVAGLAAAAGATLSASVSNSAAATATLGVGATAGSYTLAVTALGSNSDALSIDGLPAVTDPTSQNIDSGGSFTLSVNGAPGIAITATSLNGLAQAITNAGAGVQATVVNVGSNSAPDYRLSLQSDQLGNVSMQLSAGATPLLAPSGSPGVPAQYTIDGQPVSSDSDTVTLAPGLTVNLTAATTTPATITVAPSFSGVGSALQSFVSSYNSAVSELGRNFGQSGGALAGQSTVYQLTNALQGLANYAGGSGGISSMAALGVQFNDTTGQLSFDQGTFDSATAGAGAALTAFLGSATAGGFLGTATNILNGIEDPTTGSLPGEIASMQANIATTNAQIAGNETSVTQLQTNLTKQMAAADAMLYSMQQKSSVIQGILTAQQDAEIAGMG